MAKRGSDKLRGRPFVISPSAVKALLKIRQKYRIIDWLDKGQPNPDMIGGVVRLPPGRLPDFIRDLLKVPGVVPDLDIIINGKPRINDVVVRFSTR